MPEKATEEVTGRKDEKEKEELEPDIHITYKRIWAGDGRKDLAEVWTSVENAKGEKVNFTATPEAKFLPEQSTTEPLESNKERVTGVFRVDRYDEQGEIKIRVQVADVGKEATLSKDSK
ncbi:hypothetical protein AKJ40_02140 [candidate division MSBL1 archaeon SCGC-AAA259M10]|uniref:Uncharacterized protein n=2 Tax=candidate division MSBL1 TaxID=215777 RepID=A0A133U5Q8_9EURY|nr:hypothetical protein AKJ62_02940 [candidate division MSBL1 archaeon SCGC-AAA259D14]KXA99974.1 hypothetical protein AKJ40_02140 [candidate division MSBL1 archaeon SCGC-AAA259M10]